MWMLKLSAFSLVIVVFAGFTECGRRRYYWPCSPRSCQVSSWSHWSHCSHQCGTSGTQTRKRKKTIAESCGGSCSFALLETRPCNTDNCQNSGTPTSQGCSCKPGYRETCCEKVDGQWSQWTYFQCSVSCGQGRRNRQRTCTNPPPSGGGVYCSGNHFETLHCNNGPCPVDGQWSHWTYLPCAVSCGQGQRNRTRTCTSPPPIGGGKDCSGTGFETLDCYNAPCPVDGQWSQWTYFQCTTSCGLGQRNRKRTCTNPPPSGGGVYCSGNHFETQDCNNGPCPVDGQWSQWNYISCSAPCGEGKRNRTRTCTNPPPLGGGKDCSGVGLETLDCNNGPCLATDISDAEFGFAISTTSILSNSIFALMKRIIRIIKDRHGVLKIRFSVTVYGSIVTSKFTFDNINFTQEDLTRAVNETQDAPGTTDLQTALQEAEILCNLTSRPNATKAFIVLGSGTESAYRLQALFGGTLSPAEVEIFRNVTLQILQQAEDQVINANGSQPSHKHIEKRAITSDFGYPNLEDVVQMEENVQGRLLG